MVLTVQERIFLVEHTFRCNGQYTEEVRKRFEESFPHRDAPHRNAVRSLITKFRETGSVHDADRSSQATVLTEEKLDAISEAMTNSPNKSLRRLSKEANISLGSAHNAVRRNLQLYLLG